MPEVNWPIVEETTTIARVAGGAQRGRSACVSPNGASTLTAKHSSMSLRSASATPPAAQHAGVVHEHVQLRRELRGLRGGGGDAVGGGEVAPHRLAAEVDRGAPRVDLGTRVAEHPRAL